MGNIEVSPIELQAICLALYDYADDTLNDWTEEQHLFLLGLESRIRPRDGKLHWAHRLEEDST